MPRSEDKSDSPALGTMQIPRGAKIEDIAGVPPTMQATVPPLQPTAMPGPDATMPNLAPPPMPAEWRYELRSEIARGGMGRVVEANDSVLGRTVALKEALARDPEAIRRFQRETRITARLEHPSIVPVHDAGTSPNGSPFYVMRKVSGRPLEELVARTEKLEDRLGLLSHVVAAAQAIAHAHERGIVHRDIKPSNILVGDLGETIVIDWGLAKAMGEPEDPRPQTQPQVVDEDDSLKTRAGVVFGTPGFMAPEQLRGKAADEKADVYALGATLYHLLARRPPHYSKDPNEMMKSAANGPAPPLLELLPGVPPELSTIVDKALAHDRTQRYPDARALAEDLQRFLTGQLVASHRYSRREKLVRFIRKNRALVGVSSAATLALIVGGTIAVLGIMHERDRADEARGTAVEQQRIAEVQKEKVTDSLHRLTLSAAHAKTEDDPTRAVAMVAPLATESAWRQARAIGAAARAHGVAFGMPASPGVESLEMSRDGQRVLAAGDDGVVRVYDLNKRTSTTVAEVGGAVAARFADGEHAVVIAHGAGLAVIDLASGRHREVATRAKVTQLEVSGPIAYWADARGDVWRLDAPAASAPEQIALEDKVKRLSASPDGRWIAIGSDARFAILDRTQPTLPPQILADGETRDISWSADGAHGAAVVGDNVVAFEMPSGTIVHREFLGHSTAAVYVGGLLFASGATGVTVLSRESRRRHIEGDLSLGVSEARGGIVVAGGKQGVVAVITPDDDRMLRAPGVQLSRVAASPSSPWVVGAGNGVLLAWNVDAIEPHRIGDAPGAARFVTGDQIVAVFGDAAQWIDLRTDKSTGIGALTSGIGTLVPAPDGSHAFVIDGARHGTIVSPVAAPLDVGGGITAAAFADDQRLIVATDDGVVRLDQHPLVQHAGVLGVAAKGDRVAATFTGRVWRENLATGMYQELEAPDVTGAVAIAPAGDIVFGTKTQARAWHADGSVTTLATYDSPVDSIALADGHVLAVTHDGAVHTADPKPLSVVAPRASIADSGLVATVSADGVLEVIDPLAQPGEIWTLAAPKLRTFGFAQIAPDGSRVLAMTPTGVLVWPLALPATRDATAHWLDGMTNAIANPDGTIRWR